MEIVWSLHEYVRLSLSLSVLRISWVELGYSSWVRIHWHEALFALTGSATIVSGLGVVWILSFYLQVLEHTVLLGQLLVLSFFLMLSDIKLV
jgi:hypothetical protein